MYFVLEIAHILHTFMIHILAFLSQSVPRTNLGTRKSAANFSVSVSAASKALIHFRTFSEKII